MKQIISAKLKLQTTPEQFKALRHVQLAHRDALNSISRYAFEQGKMSNQRALQKATYDEIRVVYGLPAQMACNVPRQVGATYKTLRLVFPMLKKSRGPRGSLRFQQSSCSKL